MKKLLKYTAIFVVAYVVINIGLKFYTASSWKENPDAITRLIDHCKKNTYSQFNKLDPDIEKQTHDFIHTGKTFSNEKEPYQVFYKRCISKAIYYNTPQEFFNGTSLTQ